MTLLIQEEKSHKLPTNTSKTAAVSLVCNEFNGETESMGCKKTKGLNEAEVRSVTRSGAANFALHQGFAESWAHALAGSLGG
jgi:hypothetical protein